MYELNCPACKHTVRRTFLRPGAQAVCSNCAHRFSIARENVKRLAAVPADTGQDRDNPLLLDGVVARPPQPHRASPSAAGRSPMVDRDETDMAGAALGDDPSPAATLIAEGSAAECRSGGEEARGRGIVKVRVPIRRGAWKAIRATVSVQQAPPPPHPIFLI